MKAKTAQIILIIFGLIVVTLIEVGGFMQHGFWGLFCLPGLIVFFLGFVGLLKLAFIAAHGRN